MSALVAGWWRGTLKQKRAHPKRGAAKTKSTDPPVQKIDGTTHHPIFFPLDFFKLRFFGVSRPGELGVQTRDKKRFTKKSCWKVFTKNSTENLKPAEELASGGGLLPGGVGLPQ